MKEKNCIITGGTSGLGLSLVKKFIQNGFFVHIIARDNKKIKKLLNYFNEKKLNLFKFYQADLSEKTEIERVLFEIKKLNNIDIIINNAGAIFLSKELNSKGLEKTLAVNYLSHFFLTTSLIDLIKRNKKSRIINISSVAHKFANLDLNDLNCSKKYNGWIAYCNSKLMNLLFNYKIKRLYNNKVNSYAVHPGWLNTNFGNNNKSTLRLLSNFLRKLMAKNPDGMADKIFDICTKDEYLDYSGKYFNQNKVVKSSKFSYREDLQDKLWEISLNLSKVD